MSTRASVCFLAVCLILIVQVSSAYEIKPCDDYNGTLYSIEVHNCPNKKAEYCEIKMSDGIRWDVKYKAAMSYKTALTGFLYEGLGAADDHCKAQPDFCPGEAGQEQSYHFNFGISGRLIPPIGVVRPLKLITNTVFRLDKKFDKDTIVCAEFPAKFVDA